MEFCRLFDIFLCCVGFKQLWFASQLLGHNEGDSSGNSDEKSSSEVPSAWDCLQQQSVSLSLKLVFLRFASSLTLVLRFSVGPLAGGPSSGGDDIRATVQRAYLSPRGDFGPQDTTIDVEEGGLDPGQSHDGRTVCRNGGG